jgi:hypothetical protein
MFFRIGRETWLKPRSSTFRQEKPFWLGSISPSIWISFEIPSSTSIRLALALLGRGFRGLGT